MTQEEKDYVNKIIMQGLTVNTDEIEGQQVIDLSMLNLCSVDQYSSFTDDTDMSIQDYIDSVNNDPDIQKIINSTPEDLPNIINDIKTDNRIIIEFADATINDPNPVEYKISVKPGQTINNNTIIGYIKQKGELKEIKSIWETGTVMSVNNDTEYFHLYPDSCNRHIVLTNCKTGSGSTMDISILENLNDQFKEEGYLYSLITNNLAQSLLPYILSNRVRGYYSRKSLISTIPLSKYQLNDDNTDIEMELLDDSTLKYEYSYDKNFKGNQRIIHPYVILEEENDELHNGIEIYNSSVLEILDSYQDKFGADMIGSDITEEEFKSWKKRAKKKKNRKKVKNEINDKVNSGVDKYKTDNPLEAINTEKDRLLSGRSDYINNIINLYKNRDKLPLCKFDKEYTDCKCLTGIPDTGKLNDVEIKYTQIGEDDYQNYYFGLLANINVQLTDDKYTQEYYQLISDIIYKRVLIESKDSLYDILNNFCTLYKKNIDNTFIPDKNVTVDTLNISFNKLSAFIDNDENSEKTLYQKAYDYIKSIYDKSNTDSDSDENDTLLISQLATMYVFVKSYGNGDTNPYKDMKSEDNKYLYYKLVIEESNRICEFWDKIIDLYIQHDMTKCFDNMSQVFTSFDHLAVWPDYSETVIDNITYKHYLFENVYEKEYDDTDNIDISDYNFPDTVDFPNIPDALDPINDSWALDKLHGYELTEPDNPNVISIKDFKYWQKYFALATLICLPPTFWNCGLDIMPFIQMIPLPCIFVAINCVYIRLFGIIMVFGIAIRGMYVWPIILYVNTTNQPISILTPMLVIIEQIKETINDKLRDLEVNTCNSLIKLLIKQLENDNNNLRKQIKNIDIYIQACKSLPIPNAESVKQTFAVISDPSIDTRQKIQRFEYLSKINKYN